jgi:hypothetical protein
MMVFKFGVRGILSGEPAALAEMHGAHHLFNALVAVERWRRAEYAALRSRYVPRLAEVEAAYEQLSEWIGEHSGPAGERGQIREKRRRASIQGDVVIPTKRVDAEPERAEIEVLKGWRKEAQRVAKPLRAQFDAMVGPGTVAYEARTCGVPVEWIERRNVLAEVESTPESRAELAALRATIAERAPKTHAKGAANARVLAEMLIESEWHEAWKSKARLDATAHALRHWIGDAHSLNHGTYVAVAADVQQAGKRPPPRPDGEPRRPKQRPAFARGGPEGGLRKMGWQIQRVTTWGDVLAGRCSYLRVSAMRPVGGSGHKWRATIGIRVGAEWTECDVVVHRPVPEDTRIRWVYLVPRRRGDSKIDYSVQLTAEPTSPLIQRVAGTGHVDVALRWTQVGDTLDVASVNGQSLVLPGRGPLRTVKKKQKYTYGIVETLRFAESLRSTADKLFDEARVELTKRLPGMPRDVQERCATLAHWHRHVPLRDVAVALRASVPRDLILAWREERLRARLDLYVPFAEFCAWANPRGVGDVFACWLELWRTKDVHMEQMAEGVRRRATLRRREFYRVTAARLSTQYATCSISGAIDLAAFALRDKSEDTSKELHQAARHNRVLAATYELKEALERAFGRERFGTSPNAGSARDSENGATDGTPEAHADAAE